MVPGKARLSAVAASGRGFAVGLTGVGGFLDKVPCRVGKLEGRTVGANGTYWLRKMEKV